MLVHDKFVFVHVHRTGGQFASAWLRAHLDVTEVGYHAPLRDRPAALAGRPVIGFVRDPWDWYVSWYRYNAPRPRNPIFTYVSDRGRLGFAETIRQLLLLGTDDPYFAALRGLIQARLPEAAPSGHRGPGLVRADLSTMGREGYFSWLVARMLGPAPAFVGRFEALREDLVRGVEGAGVEVTPAMRADLEARAPINASERGPYVGEYDAALAEEVARADASIVARYGYRFGG